jgi:small GTP-binding protein
MADTFAYDVFLSYSSSDKQVVRELAERLRSDGIRVWFDEWQIRPGDLIGRKIERGLEDSRVLVLAMSRHALASDWATLELWTFRFRDPTNAERRFIPLRLDDADVTDALRQFAYVDWRERADEEYARLIAACRPPETAGRVGQQVPVLAALQGRAGWVWGVAVAADGSRAMSGSADGAVRVWDLQDRKLVARLEGHSGWVNAISMTPDGRLACSGGEDGTVRLWDLDAEAPVIAHRARGGAVAAVAMTPDGAAICSGGQDGVVRVWDLPVGRQIAGFEGHSGWVNGLSITADGRRICSGGDDGLVGVWSVEARRPSAMLRGHTGLVKSVAMTPDGKLACSGGEDRTVRVWDLAAVGLAATLEGHESGVRGIAVTSDGRRAVSASDDETVRVWDLATGSQAAILEGHEAGVRAVAVTPDGGQAVSGSEDGTVRVWDLSSAALAVGEAATTVRYTNAKVLLVGESGVGKTGLAYRLTEDRFRDSVSTDAVWATQLKLPQDTPLGGVEREIWLWDFAGQADYRLIHQLYMDTTALAVLVFNPQSENPFEGLAQWDEDLRRAARGPFGKLLVAGRCDRGGLMVSRKSVDRFCQERGFVEYLETSARLGTGCDALRKAIVRQIPWTSIPWTASPRIFRLLKDEIVKLKDEGRVLLRMRELRQHLGLRLPTEGFTTRQLRAVVGLLASAGIVWQLEFGDFVLLQPEYINAYASAVVRSVRAHTDEIGCIGEEEVLAGNLDYQDRQRLPQGEEQIVLRAMHQTFVDHGLCLREPTEAGTLLVFPSYFRRERPELGEHPAVFVTYRFTGSLDEIYATLVVRLHHTRALETHQLWRFAADFVTPSGKRVGLKMTKGAEGAADLSVYFDVDIPDDTKVMFIRYVHEHLRAKAQDVIRLRYYVCPYCHTPVRDSKTAHERLERGERDIVCVNCERRVPLWDLIERKFASTESQRRVRELDEQAAARMSNESRELVLKGEVYAIAGEAGQIYREYTNSDHGIDGEIEFKDGSGNASGRRLYLQLKSGDSHLRRRREDGAEVFQIRRPRHADYWQKQAYPVMLVIRTSDGRIRWMDIGTHLERETRRGMTVRQVVFEGEPFTAISLLAMRARLLARPGPRA